MAGSNGCPLGGMDVYNYFPSRRFGTRLVASIDEEVQSIWNQAKAATSSQEKAELIRQIEEIGRQQRGE